MKLWGGRFSGQTDSFANFFQSSIMFDQRLFKHDISGSLAHAKMLGKQGIISSADAHLITQGLTGILAELEAGSLKIDLSFEDIHSFVEAELVKRIGEAGKRLHTGRSRNDQVALDMRMYVKEETKALKKQLLLLLETLSETAKLHLKTVMPGFTHLQKAQPITLAHHLMAYFQMFKRDYERLCDLILRTDEMPLGAGALAGTSYPLDRDLVKDLLGFKELTKNSLDSVSDRDFCMEFVFSLSLIMTHLSRFCEEIIIWATDSFGFIEISDAYSTGSSIMPQKKNPDIAELIRGKTGRVYGNLISLLTVMKALPLAYNKDMQEDKEAVFDAADTVKACLFAFTGMIENITFNKEKMSESAGGGYTDATDAADYLVKKGVPFREAHEMTGKLVSYAVGKNKRLGELTLNEFKDITPVFDEDIFTALMVENLINSRSLPGGPGEKAVLNAINDGILFIRKNQADE
ncbi:MAG: argininosuccinate lyase [Lachnospiraceae bacterium]|nr:argininosuccinate lyase [Lachnospiraceae bacterium]